MIIEETTRGGRLILPESAVAKRQGAAIEAVAPKFTQLSTPAREQVVILIVSATPVDTDRLEVGKEVNEIKAAWRQSSFRSNYQIVYEPALTASQLQMHLLEYKPDILHFAGHAETHGVLVEDASGRKQVISNEAMVNALKLFQEHGLRCVVLNACYSESLARALASEVGCAVGMNAAVGDGSAIKFARGFYRAICNRQTVRFAFESARAEVDLEALPHARLPRLRHAVDPDTLFFPPEEPTPLWQTASFEPETLNFPPMTFTMGATEEDASKHESPPFEVTLAAFRIGRKPVTNAQYYAYLHDTEQTSSIELRWKDGTMFSAEQAEQPVNGVTWDEARTYCDWLEAKTGRPYTLPTEAQWECAAKFTEDPIEFDPQIREWTTSLWGERHRSPEKRYQYPYKPNDERDDLRANAQIRRVTRGGGTRATKRTSELPTQRGLAANRIGFRVALNANAA